VLDNVTNGIKAWLVGRFASAINHTTRPEDRVLAIRWLSLSLSKPKFGWQVKPNRAMFLSYERSLQPDLVGAGIIVPNRAPRWQPRSWSSASDLTY